MVDRAGKKPMEILLVEDNSGDVLLTKEAFKRAKVRNNLTVAEDGEIALEMLYKKGAYAGVPTPDLILLDLNLPKISGQQVLEQIKKCELMRRIPVVVLSSSKAERDINQTYDLYANSYISKPINIQELTAIVQSIESFWFSVVQLPVKP